MIFLGDIALPHEVKFNVVSAIPIFRKKITIGNLEGGIHDVTEVTQKEYKIFNSPEVIRLLKDLNVKVVSLANNHITDVSRNPGKTVAHLRKNSILACGAGDSIDTASEPVIISNSDKEILFLAFGWHVIGCVYANKRQGGVNPLYPSHIFKTLNYYRKHYPDAIIIILMHWGYELELYPLPMHRQLAFDLIDYGVDGVIGSHAHCVQGVEIYKNKPIVYGLGNWVFPHGEYWNYRLVYPDIVKRQLAFEWDVFSGEKICHWFIYEDEDGHTVKYYKSEYLEESEYIKRITSYTGLSHNEYVQWFKENRHKKKLLPVYGNYRMNTTNFILDLWMAVRSKLIELLKPFLIYRQRNR